MFNQIITFRAPAADILVIRDIIITAYLPIVSQQPGFSSASMLEHANDAGHLQLVVVWQSPADCMTFRCSGGIARIKRLLRMCLPDALVSSQDVVVGDDSAGLKLEAGDMTGEAAIGPRPVPEFDGRVRMKTCSQCGSKDIGTAMMGRSYDLARKGARRLDVCRGCGHWAISIALEDTSQAGQGWLLVAQGPPNLNWRAVNDTPGSPDDGGLLL